MPAPRFLPAAERSRREAEPSKKPYLDGVTYVVGSLLGKQDCSNMIACRAGKFVQVGVARPADGYVSFVSLRGKALSSSLKYESFVDLFCALGIARAHI